MSPRLICCAALVLLAGTSAHAQTPQTIVLPCTRDNTMFESSTGTLSNGIGPYTFAGRTAQGRRRRALYHFDATAIPPGATIVSAELRLLVNQTAAGPFPFRIHRMLKDWGEGTSNSGDPGGTGAQARTGDATWIHSFYPTVLWSAAGGSGTSASPDFVATASATTTIDFPDAYTWSSAAVTADVQGWVANPASNFGWILIGTETQRSAKRLGSRENELEGARPRLTVTYTVPVCTANCDGSTTIPVLNALDFSCFLSRYQAGDPYANCDGSTTIPTLNALDFSCYLDRFAAGCP